MTTETHTPDQLHSGNSEEGIAEPRSEKLELHELLIFGRDYDTNLYSVELTRPEVRYLIDAAQDWLDDKPERPKGDLEKKLARTRRLRLAAETTD